MNNFHSKMLIINKIKLSLKQHQEARKGWTEYQRNKEKLTSKNLRMNKLEQIQTQLIFLFNK